MDSEALKFKSTCEQENTILAAITEKEAVSEEMAYEALIIVKNLKLIGVGDALIYASALNVLNTYVKQSKENKKAVGYSFKKNVDVLIKYVVKNPNELIKAEIQKDRDMSLCIAEIGGIQFSFHNIEMNSYNKQIAVKEGEETLKWDGIRKQNCAVTVFDFAMASEYDRGNKMMDGSDFEEGLSAMTDKYRAGTSTIDDAKHVIYGDGKNGASSARIEAKETVVYPYRNEPVAPLYQGDMGTFIEELDKRTFVAYLVSVYEQNFGFKLPTITEIEWKYAFESLLRELDKMEVRPDCGIRIDCCRFSGTELLVVDFISSNPDNTVNVAAVMLLTWEEMSYETDGSVTYSDYDSSVKLKTAHPSYIMTSYMNVEFRYISNDPDCDIRSCVYMYDASYSDKTDIVSNCPKEIIDPAPIFYSDNRDEMRPCMEKALAGGNGRTVISGMNKAHEESKYKKDGTVSSEHIYITEKIIRRNERNKSGLVVFNNRKSCGNDDYINYFKEQLDAHGVNYTLFRSDEEAETYRRSADRKDAVIFYDFVPDSINFEQMPKCLILVDEYALDKEERGRLTYLVEEAVDSGTGCTHYETVAALGYADIGGGNNWLIRNLTLGDIDYQRWVKELYPIEILDDPSELQETEGTANVIIPASVTYDKAKGSIRAEYDVKTEIYRALTSGEKGVRLYIEDGSLKAHLREALEESIRHSEWRDTAFHNAGGNVEEYIRKIKESLNNTNSYITYEQLAKQFIGISAWNKMSEDSRDWLVSALLSFNDMKNTDPLMDFSGVTLMISKVFENELTKRYSNQYEAYLQKKYGERYMEELPEALVEVNQFGETKVLTANRLTLGSIPFIMGMDSRGNVKNEHEYENFKAFCEDVLLEDTADIDGTLKEICEIVYYVRVNFRNKSAHKDVIDLMIATDCVEYCITVKRKLGCLMDMFSIQTSASEMTDASAAAAAIETVSKAEPAAAMTADIVPAVGDVYDADKSAQEFIEECENENKILAAIEVKEDVTEEHALKAEVIINNMDIRGVGDVLLYAASLNLLNTYVKINKDNHDAVGYSFKKKVDDMISYLADNPDPMIRCEVQEESGMVLFMMEVNSIQFSYHQIDLDSDSRKLMAKDLNNPEIKWDGIRKQTCSVSVFDFAMDNGYGRGRRMLDGTDFDEGLKTLTGKYHDGEFTIADSKHPVYANAAPQCTLKLSADIKEGDTRRNLPAGVLLTTDAAAFVRKAENGSLVPELIKTCTEVLKFELCESAESEWKDAIAAFTSSIQKAEINGDAGISLFYLNYFGQDHLMAEIASMNSSYKCNIALMWLVPWSRMKLKSNDAVAVSDEKLGEIKCTHPSKTMQIIMQCCTQGIFNNQKYHVNPCVMLYNAGLTDETDIVSYYNADDLKRVPVFYRDDEKAVTDAISAACMDGRGMELIADMEQLLSGYLVPVDGGLPNEHRYIIDSIIGKLWDKHKNVTMINLHKAKGCTEFEDELVRRLEDAGEPYAIYGIEGVKEKADPAARTVIYSGIIPKEYDMAGAVRYILIIDKNRFSREKYDALDAFLDASRAGGARIDSYRPAIHLGYKDMGCGVCWIMRMLDIGNEKSRMWIPDLYSIEVIKKDKEFNADKNIAHVNVNYEYTIDMIKNEIHASSQQKRIVYEQLITGTDGAQLKIYDVALKTYIDSCTEADKDRFESIKSINKP